MQRLALLVLLIVLAGCEQTQRIDRAALDQRYQDTQFADGVLSIVPLRIEPGEQAPVVVNWWYAGTSDGQHTIVYRELTWDSERKPVGREARYRIAQTGLKVVQPIATTQDSRLWLPLYEAAPDDIEPPTDLPTARKAPKPIEIDPIAQPDKPTLPAID